VHEHVFLWGMRSAPSHDHQQQTSCRSNDEEWHITSFWSFQQYAKPKIIHQYDLLRRWPIMNSPRRATPQRQNQSRNHHFKQSWFNKFRSISSCADVRLP
jgi:hypothetical protein